MDTRFLDDLAAGQTFTTNGVTLTEGDIIDFAWRYDPQPFHLDVGAATRSPYGGLIASGFQSLALCFRLFIQTGVFLESSIGSPGIDELRWLVPVRPGDTVQATVTVKSVDPAKARAVLETVCRVGGQVVIDGEATVMTTSRARREAGAAKAESAAVAA